MGSQETQVKHPFLLHLFSGAAAGFTADTSTFPIDTIRARMQVQRAAEMQYTGSMSVLKRILAEEGPRGLYKGYGIVAACTLPAHALYFSGYEYGKKKLGEVTRTPDSPLVHFLSGMFADVCGAVVWVPQDVIKQRMQIQLSPSSSPSLPSAPSSSPSFSLSAGTSYRNSMQAFSQVFREEGIRGLYKGTGAALATYAPFVGFYFMTYERCKVLFCERLSVSNADNLPFWTYVVSGFGAGATSAALSCPMDVIKTRYKGILDAVSRIRAEEGYSAFFKGLAPRVMWIAPATAISIAAYEQYKQLFTKWFT